MTRSLLEDVSCVLERITLSTVSMPSSRRALEGCRYHLDGTMKLSVMFCNARNVGFCASKPCLVYAARHRRWLRNKLASVRIFNMTRRLINSSFFSLLFFFLRRKFAGDHSDWSGARCAPVVRFRFCGRSLLTLIHFAYLNEGLRTICIVTNACNKAEKNVTSCCGLFICIVCFDRYNLTVCKLDYL